MRKGQPSANETKSGSPPTSQKKGEPSLSDDIFIEAVAQLYRELTVEWDQIFRSEGAPSGTIRATALMTIRAMRLSEAVQALSKANLGAEAFNYCRLPIENFTNLHFILYAGPSVEGKTREELASQFLGYAALSHLRLINSNTRHLPEYFDSRLAKGLTVEGYIEHLEDQAAHYMNTYHPGKKRGQVKNWTSMDLPSLLRCVLAHLPKHFNYHEHLLDLAAASLPSMSSGLHSDSFSLRHFHSTSGNSTLFIDVRKSSPDFVFLASHLALACICSLGFLLDHAGYVVSRHEQILSQLVRVHQR